VDSGVGVGILAILQWRLAKGYQSGNQREQNTNFTAAILRHLVNIKHLLGSLCNKVHNNEVGKYVLLKGILSQCRSAPDTEIRACSNILTENGAVKIFIIVLFGKYAWGYEGYVNPNEYGPLLYL
jgi:hypothetical protein